MSHPDSSTTLTQKIMPHHHPAISPLSLLACMDKKNDCTLSTRSVALEAPTSAVSNGSDVTISSPSRPFLSLARAQESAASETVSPITSTFVLPRLLRYAEIMRHKKRMVQCVFDEATLRLARLVVNGKIVREVKAAAAAPQHEDPDEQHTLHTPLAATAHHPDETEASVALETDSETDTEDGEEYSLQAAEKRMLVYEILETGGFLKLYLKPHARLYWHLQALAGHRAPDWKIHLSVCSEDHARAWDILVTLFIAWRCRSGLKIETQGPGTWPAWQRGREITVYIYRFSPAFAPHMDTLLSVSQADEHSATYWRAFVAAVERGFAEANIRSNGLADGDLKWGTYASLRNEAFVKLDPAWELPAGWSGVDLGVPEGARGEGDGDDEGEGEDGRSGGDDGGSGRSSGKRKKRSGRMRLMTFVYPPNFTGHNAAGHLNPLDDEENERMEGKRGRNYGGRQRENEGSNEEMGEERKARGSLWRWVWGTVAAVALVGPVVLANAWAH